MGKRKYEELNIDKKKEIAAYIAENPEKRRCEVNSLFSKKYEQNISKSALGRIYVNVPHGIYFFYCNPRMINA